MSNINFKMNVEIDGKQKKRLSKKFSNITFDIIAKIKEKSFKVPFNSFNIEFLNIIRNWMKGISSPVIESMSQNPTTKDIIVTVNDYDDIEIGDKVSFVLSASQMATTALASFAVSNSQTIEDIEDGSDWKLDAKTTDPTISGNIITCTDEDYSLLYSDTFTVGLGGREKSVIIISGKTSNKMIQFVMGKAPTAGVLLDEENVSQEITGDFNEMKVLITVPSGANVFGIKMHGAGVTEIYQFDVYPVYSSGSNTAYEILGTELLVKGKQLDASSNPQIILETTSKINIASGILPAGFEGFPSYNNLFSIMGINTNSKGILLGNSSVNKNVDRKYSDVQGDISPHMTAFNYSYPPTINLPFGQRGSETHNIFSTVFNRMIIANGTVKANDLFLVGQQEDYSGMKQLYSWDKFPTELSFELADAITVEKTFQISQSISMGGLNPNFLLSILYGMLLGKQDLTVSPIYPFFVDDSNNTYTKMYPGLLKVLATGTENWGIVLGNTAANLAELRHINLLMKIGANRKTFKEYTEYNTVSTKFTKSDVQITKIESDGETIREFSIKRMFTAKEDVSVGSAILLPYHSDSGISKYIPLAFNLLKGVGQVIDVVAGQSIVITFTFSIDHTDDITAL